MLLLFFSPVYCESKKVPYRFAKDLKLKQSDGPFVLIFFVWVCTRQYSCTAVDICCTDILCFLSLCEPNLLITFTQCLFMPIKYLPWLFVHKSLFRYAFFICALFHFFLIHSALLCAMRGVCCVSPAALNCVQGRRCISINTSVCERRSYSSFILPAGHVWLIELYFSQLWGHLIDLFDLPWFDDVNWTTHEPLNNVMGTSTH